MERIPRNYIVPDHATDETDLQLWLMDHIDNTGMDPISIALNGSVLAVKAERSVCISCRL